MSAFRRTLAVSAIATLVIAVVGAADLKVDLSAEQVGKPPRAFEPMVGTWIVAQDEGQKMIMVDGRPWAAPVLKRPVSGRVGLWAKADSTSYFRNDEVTTR